MFSFTPLRDFFSPELKSHYITGLTYTVRPGNEVLATAVKVWMEDGLVVPSSASSKIHAAGEALQE